MNGTTRLGEAIKQTQIVIDNTEKGATHRLLEEAMENLNAGLESFEQEDEE